MTAVERLTGAASNPGNIWKAVNWQKVIDEIKRLQMRIAKAVREGKLKKAKILQWLLTHSFYAKLLAVKTVTSNTGAITPGIDGVIWNTPRKKMMGALSLKRSGYKAKPLRRIEIPKKDGSKRPLGIPTVRDRAMQAMHLLSLLPAAEMTADHNSYGFRPYRACRDAIGQCFCSLAKSYSPKWVLDADIKACFDGIDHDWLMQNIPADKRMLKQWLKCGYIQNKKLFPTISGTPQGGIISPTLANMTLDGLEKAVKTSCPSRTKVNFIRYADDFVCTAADKELIEKKILPAINGFLKPRGLILSAKKTKIVRIEDGFDFLSQNIRKYRNKLITVPSSKASERFLENIRTVIKTNKGLNAEGLINRLNSQIRGWSNYHRYAQSAETFAKADTIIFNALCNWAKRKHPHKSAGWINRKYFSLSGKKWVFSCEIKDKRGNRRVLELLRTSSTKLLRYIKIKGKANPFDSEYEDYFRMRRELSNAVPVTVGTIL